MPLNNKMHFVRLIIYPEEARRTRFQCSNPAQNSMRAGDSQASLLIIVSRGFRPGDSHDPIQKKGAQALNLPSKGANSEPASSPVFVSSLLPTAMNSAFRKLSSAVVSPKVSSCDESVG